MKTLVRSFCLVLCCISNATAADTLHLDLPNCISRAKRDGAAARVIRMEYTAQRFDHDAARADFLPRLSFATNIPGYSRGIIPVLQPDGSFKNLPQTQTYSDATLSLSQKLPFSGGDLFISSSLNNRINTTSERTEFWQSAPAMIQLYQPIFGVNSYAYYRELESVRFEAATRSYIEQMENVAIEATASFFDYYISCMNVENSLLNIAINDSIYVLAKGRYNFGKIAENDLLQNELAVLSAKTEYERARLLRERSRAALCLAIGIDDNSAIEAIPPLKIPELTINEAEALSSAMARRSELKNYESQVLAADNTVSNSRANNRFKASITASYGLNQTARDAASAYKNPLDQERLSLNVEVPLITWGQTSSQVESAEAQKQRTGTQTSLLRIQLQQDVIFGVRDFQQLNQLVAIADKAQQIAARRYEVARGRYIIGKIETTELMLSQREKDDSRRSFYATLRDYWTSYYRLRKICLYDFETGKPIDAESIE